MKEKPILANSLAGKLERTYKSAGFKVFWDQILREKRRAEVMVLATPRHDVQSRSHVDSLVVPGLTEREFNYRKGWLDAILYVERVKEELLVGLSKGEIPWRQLRPPEESDEARTHGNQGPGHSWEAWERPEERGYGAQQEGPSPGSDDAGDDAPGDEA